MAKFSMIIFSMVLCMMLVTPLHAQTISCQTVVDDLTPCLTYLKEGGDVPASCCSSIRALNSEADTTADRQSVCNCLKAAAEAYGVDAQYAAELPSECDVDIGYAISESTDCSDVQ